MDSVDILEKAIRQSNLLNKYMLKEIGIFGSFARGEPANDIDFYIDADSCKLADLRKYANPIVLHRALKDMVYVTA